MLDFLNPSMPASPTFVRYVRPAYRSITRSSSMVSEEEFPVRHAALLSTYHRISSLTPADAVLVFSR